MTERDPNTSLFAKLKRWWRGNSDPATLAESKRVQEEVDTQRASAGGGNPYGLGGTHGHESDYRAS
jgi:hypothetical protein